MRDWDVRKELDLRLRGVYGDDPKTRVLPEMVLARGASRIDFAVVNGALHGYEIKSDADTLNRLGAQSEAYNAVFDEITIVVGARHFLNAAKYVPPWWGMVVAEMADSTVRLTDFRPARPNPHQSVRALADLLWKEEAAQLLRDYCGVKVTSKKTRDALSIEISERLELTAVANFTREALKSRAGWRVDERQG